MKKIILAVIILALAVFVFWFFSKPKGVSVETNESSLQEKLPAGDTMELIGKDIEKEANTGDLNDDLKNIKDDLQSL